MTLVSIYITNFNYERFIRQSIESVLNQTFQDFELFIIDDGSTDQSRNIIEDYRSNLKVTIIYQKNKGLNATNNVAMYAASGKYFMRLDADDFLEPNALETMVSIMEKDGGLGLVFPDYYYVDAEGHITGEEKRHDFEKDVSLYDQPAHGACTMVRLEYLRALGGYNEAFTCQDGYELWIKFILNYKVGNINQPLFYYRRHDNNLTGNEERILNTRQKIKAHYVATHGIKLPKTVAVIPVRNTFIGDVNWPLHVSDGRTILAHAIDKASRAKNVQWVVVISADDKILGHAQQQDCSKLMVMPRPAAYEKISEPLNKTFDLVLNEMAEKGMYPGAIMSVSLEYPFITSEIIDDAVNTLTLFNGDSLLSVRPDNRMYYQHVGHGMVPILDQDKFTKLEREALYKGAGGVVISTLENYHKNKRLVAGKVGHIVVGSEAAFSIRSTFDFNLFSSLSTDTIKGKFVIAGLEQ